MENPNEYNDSDFARYSSQLDSAVGALWESGASLDDIREIISNAFENHLPEKVEVDINAS